jgi:hypothetical protein
MDDRVVERPKAYGRARQKHCGLKVLQSLDAQAGAWDVRQKENQRDDRDSAAERGKRDETINTVPYEDLLPLVQGRDSQLRLLFIVGLSLC